MMTTKLLWRHASIHTTMYIYTQLSECVCVFTQWFFRHCDLFAVFFRLVKFIIEGMYFRCACLYTYENSNYYIRVYNLSCVDVWLRLNLHHLVRIRNPNILVLSLNRRVSTKQNSFLIIEIQILKFFKMFSKYGLILCIIMEMIFITYFTTSTGSF